MGCRSAFGEKSLYQCAQAFLFYILLYEGSYWVGLGTIRESELLTLHLAINEVLNSLGIKVINRTVHISPISHGPAVVVKNRL